MMGCIRNYLASSVVTLLIMCTLGPAHGAERAIYPAPDQATTELASALAAAAADHKRVILDFGGNWCTDCHVLDHYFHDPVNAAILRANFIVVHVNIGRMSENLDLAERYQIPLRKGVPALAVLGEKGEILYSQKAGEFEAMRGLQSSAVTEFLNRWKPPAA